MDGIQWEFSSYYKGKGQGEGTETCILAGGFSMVV